MAVFINEKEDELIVTCDCGCDESFHIKVENDDNEFAFLTYMKSNWYADQNYTHKNVFLIKLKKIWSILKGKDYHYSDTIMSKEDFETFITYINKFYLNKTFSKFKGE